MSIAWLITFSIPSSWMSLMVKTFAPMLLANSAWAGEFLGPLIPTWTMLVAFTCGICDAR